MKGPILGILTIFLLQLGFISYTQVNSILESTAEIGPISAPANPFPAYSDLDLVDADASDVEIAYSAPTVRSRAKHVVASPRPIRKRPVFRTFETELAPVAIRVPRSSPYVFASYDKPATPEKRTERPPTVVATVARIEDEPIRVNTVERKKRRNFASKALAVIRKPFDWVKAVGSKLR